MRRLRDVRIHAERVLAGDDRPYSSRPMALLVERLTLLRSA